MFLFHFMNLDFFWIGDDGDNFSTVLGQFKNYVNFQKIFREARLRGVTIERGFSAIELSWQMSISSKYRIAPHVHWTLHHTKCPGCFYTALSHTEPWMLLVPHWAALRWAFPQFIAQFHPLHTAQDALLSAILSPKCPRRAPAFNGTELGCMQ